MGKCMAKNREQKGLIKMYHEMRKRFRLNSIRPSKAPTIVREFQQD
jgi:hypothetical protein